MPEKTVQKEPGKKPVPSKKPKPQQEVVVQISLSELHPFPDHPFQVREDASMQETAESVKEYGVLVPALARPREDGGYELIAGHRRKHACELAGLATMPVIVRDIDRDAATIIMVDSNLQRENILPSERAKAYKMKMEAIKRQGARTDLTSPKISAKFRSDDEVGQDAGVSGDTIRNYIALTQLVPELQQMVDEKKIALSPAYQIAALTPKEQGLLLEEMTPLKYIFREDEPQHLRYRIEELEHAPTDEERAEYAKDGWQEVCHYELDYVFAKECSADEPEVSQEAVLRDLDKKIEKEKGSIRETKIGLLIALVILAVCVFSMGRAALSGDTLLIALRFFGPTALIAFAGGYWEIRKLRRKKERVEDGDIPDEYTNWRKDRVIKALLALVGVVLIVGGTYYGGNFNDKTFDLPEKSTYANLPAVRLESLIAEPLMRCGESVDPAQEGLHMSANQFDGMMYQTIKRMGGLYNYGVEHRFELRTKRDLETKQYMQNAEGAEWHLNTRYTCFRRERDAEKQYDKNIENERLTEERWQERGHEFPASEEISMEYPAFSHLHVCRTEWSESVSYHVLCRDSEKLMELDYTGREIDPEQLLAEIEKVFAAQEG